MKKQLLEEEQVQCGSFITDLRPPHAHSRGVVAAPCFVGGVFVSVGAARDSERGVHAPDDRCRACGPGGVVMQNMFPKHRCVRGPVPRVSLRCQPRLEPLRFKIVLSEWNCRRFRAPTAAKKVSRSAFDVGCLF